MLFPEPDDARELLRDELSSPVYTGESLLDRIRGAIDDLLSDITSAAAGAGAFSFFVALLLAVAVVALAVFVIARVRRSPRVRMRREGAVIGEETLDAAQVRRRAQEALQRGDSDSATLDAFRAIALSLSERALVELFPGSTAHEIADDAAPRFPAYADRLHEGANLFDALLYGDRSATTAQATAMLELDERLGQTRPTAGSRSSRLMVPR